MISLAKNDHIVFDQVLASFGSEDDALGAPARNSALYEMNAPGSVQLVEEDKRDSWNKGRKPFVNEINFDDALTDVVYLLDRNGKLPRRVEHSNRLRIKCRERDGKGWKWYVHEDDRLGIPNPNASVMGRDEFNELIAKTYDIPGFVVSDDVTHFYMPKDHVKHLIKSGFGGPEVDSSTSKMFVKMDEGFYFLRAWFTGDRMRRCQRPKTLRA